MHFNDLLRNFPGALYPVSKISPGAVFRQRTCCRRRGFWHSLCRQIEHSLALIIAASAAKGGELFLASTSGSIAGRWRPLRASLHVLPTQSAFTLTLDYSGNSPSPLSTPFGSGFAFFAAGFSRRFLSSGSDKVVLMGLGSEVSSSWTTPFTTRIESSSVGSSLPMRIV